MNIELDAKEYRDLLDIVHIADVIMSGHERGENTRSERHRLLIQKLYALAKNAGFESLMQYDETAKKHVPSQDFERSTLAHVELNEFGEHLFWDHLINRLSQRDAAQLAGGLEQLSTMDEKDRHELFHAIQQRYAQEFGANDILHLRLVEPLETAAGIPVKTSD